MLVQKRFSTRWWPLALGDSAVFGLFAALGRTAHSGSVDPLEIGEIAAPFVVAWLVVAPWMQLYDGAVATAPREVLKRVAATWMVAGPLGLALRAGLWHKDVQMSFAITTLLINLGLLELWRVGIAAYLQRRKLF